MDTLYDHTFAALGSSHSPSPGRILAADRWVSYLCADTYTYPIHVSIHWSYTCIDMSIDSINISLSLSLSLSLHTSSIQIPVPDAYIVYCIITQYRTHRPAVHTIINIPCHEIAYHVNRWHTIYWLALFVYRNTIHQISYTINDTPDHDIPYRTISWCNIT